MHSWHKGDKENKATLVWRKRAEQPSWSQGSWPGTFVFSEGRAEVTDILGRRRGPSRGELRPSPRQTRTLGTSSSVKRHQVNTAAWTRLWQQSLPPLLPTLWLDPSLKSTSPMWFGKSQESKVKIKPFWFLLLSIDHIEMYDLNICE
jgi:hypothetical protein